MCEGCRDIWQTGAIYTCTNKRCRNYHREFFAPSPGDWRRFTGQSMTCDQCGRLVTYKRTATRERQSK